MKNILWIAICTAFLFGCSNAEKKTDDTSQKAKMDSNRGAEMVPPPPDGKLPVSSGAAQIKAKDSNRKVIRTADLKFQAKDVIKATYGIEAIVDRNDGFVSSTNLESNISSQNTTPVSADSSVESTYYTVTNIMTIRVPNTRLDTTLKSIAYWIDFLDSRTIKADDVSLQILSNKLVQKRNTMLQKRLTKAVDSKGKKLIEMSDVESSVNSTQQQSDEAMVSNLSLADQIKYSTVNLDIYQRQQVRKVLVANEKDIKSFEPGFGFRIIQALRTGWEGCEEVILFFLKIWWLVIVGIAAIIIYRRLNRKQSSNS